MLLVSRRQRKADVEFNHACHTKPSHTSQDGPNTTQVTSAGLFKRRDEASAHEEKTLLQFSWWVRSKAVSLSRAIVSLRPRAV